MPDILHDFPTSAGPAEVFQAVATPEGLNRWWTAEAAGQPALGNEYQLWFGPEYDWRATVAACDPGRLFEMEITAADADWTGTRVRFRLAPRESGTLVEFAHTGWLEANAHFRRSSYCWAMYLRLLQRYLEQGETVPYADRLGA